MDKVEVEGIVLHLHKAEEANVSAVPGEVGHGEVVDWTDHALTPFIIASFASFIIPFIANCLVGSFLDA